MHDLREYWTPKQRNKTAQPNKQLNITYFSPFNCVLFCSLEKELKQRSFFNLKKHNLLCVWILRQQRYASGVLTEQVNVCGQREEETLLACV